MLNPIDNLLNQITMYRLVLYGLIFLLVAATAYAFLGILPFGGFTFLFSVFFIFIVCYLFNILFSEAFNVPVNVESFYITAFILALIISPPKNMVDLIFIFWASVLAMASKFIFTYKLRHIFNPVAISIFLTATFIGKSATWWVGNLAMLIPVSIVGFLIVRKIRRANLTISFLGSALATISIFGFFKSTPLLTSFSRAIIQSPLIFFATIMSTEPLTTPATETKRNIYGILTGILFAPQFHIGTFFTTPEMALLIGNVYAFLVSPKDRLILALREKIKIGSDVYDFIFDLPNKFNFTAGQYMEFTLGHDKSDSRGVRRYFTLANSPTEGGIRLGVKFHPEGSSYKNAMLNMKIGDKISGSQLSGDMTLPGNVNQRIAFFSGGIGITPFRSIIKYLIDKNEKRDITLFCADKIRDDISYKEIFDEAAEKFGLKSIYTLTEMDKIPPDWTGERGRFTPEKVMKYLPDYKDRLFYLSGPHGMVEGFKSMLKSMGVPDSQLKLDYFPGF